MVLILSISPCCSESENCLRDDLVEKNCENHKSGEEDESHLPCSPFYSCGNCMGFTFGSKILFEFTFIAQNTSQVNDFYLDYVSVGFSILPLKPPKFI